MPSRTYIQMILKLHNAGKLPLCKEVLNNALKYNAVLEKHPEVIEEIVRRRVTMVAYAKKYVPDTGIMVPHMVTFERCIIDSMFLEELIESPVFDNFVFGRNLHRIAIGFQPVVSNAIVKIDLGGK